MLDPRLVSRTCSGDHFIVVVKDRKKRGDNRVASSGVLDVIGTVLVDLRLGVGEGLVGAHGSVFAAKIAEVAIQWVNDRSIILFISHQPEKRCNGATYCDKLEESSQFKTLSELA